MSTADSIFSHSGVCGVGIDLVEVERIRASHQRHGDRFLERVFTEGERAYCTGLKNPYPHLAARFAAKEAVSKALGTGITGEFSWHSAAVAKGEQEEPLIVLDAKGRALLKKCGGTKVLVSLTHTATLAQAIAVVVREDSSTL